MGDSRIGSRFRDIQARTLGQYSAFEPHGENSGPGVANDTFNFVGSSPPAATDKGPYTALENGGDDGDLAASAIVPRATATLDKGLLVVYNAWHTNQAIANLDADYAIGVLDSGFEVSVDDGALFAPGVGQSTAGNIRVRTSGTDHDGTITYPTISNGSIYTAIVIDNDQDQTRFFIGQNPFFDDETASIGFTPDEIGPIGGQITANGVDDTEELRMSISGYIYVP